MTKENRKLILIFNRDFSQWTNQMLRNGYVFDFPRLWGRGLEDQIVRFTGRSTEIYRYADDYRALSEYMVRKPLNASIFTEIAHQQFRKDVLLLRKLSAMESGKIKNFAKHLQDITEIFRRMYPLYTLSVFLPGPWREQFLKMRGKKAENIIHRVFKSRELSEGVGKICDTHLRIYLGPLLKRKSYPTDWAKLLSVEETRRFVDNGKLPVAVIKKRAQGFVFLGGKIIPTNNFNQFLKLHHLEIESGETSHDETELRGNVACRGGVFRGKVRTIFNSSEVSSFKKGDILVTPMTSPEYLPALKKAKAIITDEGGVTCHAAIVSRELGIPCIIGTKIATKVFKDGDLVEIESARGIVRKI